MNELIENIKALYKRYENDSEGLTRLKTYVTEDINDMMDMYEEEKEKTRNRG